MKKVIVIGGGISGLTIAYYLSKKADVTVLEQSDRLGGWIRTQNIEGFLFEYGPRGIRLSGNGQYTQSLAEELNLPFLFADPAAKKRFIALNSKLQSVSPAFLIRSGLVYGVLKDLLQRPSSKEDETIASFSHRHFGKKLTKRCIDPLCRGIFGGDYTTLSARSCFPTLWEKDHRVGSLLRQRKKHHIPGIVSFALGMQQLVDYLSSSDITIKLNTKVTSIAKNRVEIGSESLSADYIILAVSSKVLSHLLNIKDPHHYATIATINMGWKTPLLKHKGYGFLVPSYEKEKVMGMTFDSHIFPSQPGATRICAMIGEEASKHDLIDWTQHALHKYCKVTQQPDVVDVKVASQAIPQYGLGHHSWVQEVTNILPDNSYAIGSALKGVGVNDCIADAAGLAFRLKQQLLC